MKFIAHRGNFQGSDHDCENTPGAICEALDRGLDVEVDVWYHANKFWLGHDVPSVSVRTNLLDNQRVWCHAKSVQTLEVLNRLGIHCFFQSDEPAVFTSKGFLWIHSDYVCFGNNVIIHVSQFKPGINVYGVYGDNCDEALRKLLC